MKKIKVYLQKPWRFSEDSQYYQLLYDHPPESIKYIAPKKTKLLQRNKKLLFLDSLKRIIRRGITVFYPSMPNAHYDEGADKYDLIHCMRCISKNKKPWICDIEFPGGFWVTTEFIKGGLKRNVLKYLESSYCKKIMPWTEWCANGLKNAFPEMKDKIEVVYPAVCPKKFKKIKTEKTVLLYVSRRFYFKGGLYALEVMNRITKENKNIEGWIVSDVPKDIYEKYKKNNQIKFMGTHSQNELFEKIYPSADIFLYPSLTDTFGYVILEAMSFGLPVISLDGQSRKELISDNKTGKIVNLGFGDDFDPSILRNLDEKIVGKLLAETTTLVRNKTLVNEMSRNCIIETSSGKFSIKERNKKLKRIIKEALK